jgi:hypothetical protein
MVTIAIRSSRASRGRIRKNKSKLAHSNSCNSPVNLTTIVKIATVGVLIAMAFNRQHDGLFWRGIIPVSDRFDPAIAYSPPQESIVK